MSTLDKLRGMLVGLAIGDALGAPVEFMPRGTFPPVAGYRAGGPHNLEAGYWTDDTSMALCSGASLIQCNAHDPNDQMQRYQRWYRHGYMSSTGRCFDIGNQTRRAIQRFEREGIDLNRAIHPDDIDSAGNGALMRLAPVAIKYHADVDKAIDAAADNAALTHSDPRCIDANKAFTFLLIRALNSTDKAQLLATEALSAYFSETLNTEVNSVIQGSYRQLSEPQVESTGYVVTSLEAALWAFYNASSFEEGAKLAVNLGDDADTIGAIYGQIAGAFWGYSAMPKAWITALHDAARIITVADLLADGITDQHLETLIKHATIPRLTIDTL
ncbi:ADP-ribosylglycohydrolase family protein [Amphritea sp. 1_MG-2023]|uniref:ADP-ribosylglycohydrolase family protein n=1 Tax=Amphritea sp. 1_MG-2023 TaxID=3062670 RepID=UPI0026E3B58E|nr:ADP-ribosylglycohydrolase family protein [Amphritea sp. 1_MG-2023]MDO6564641.1 ADP-ribosylglycohydrolase family protein [Amphritea sp. 1_MG-2023]